MSYLTEVNCPTILEAIKNEKQNQSTNENADDYVLLYKVNTFWTDLFAKCFLCDGRLSVQHDDMLFFVTKSIGITSNDQERVQVYRYDSKKLPCLTDLNYDWEETIYLNLILHEFQYTLTCAICTQTSAKDLQILKRHSKPADPITSQEICQFFVEKAFNEMIVNEGEMVCVELTADDGKTKRVLFLGSIKYEALKKVYDGRATTGSKIVEKVSFGALNQKRVEFMKMRGPLGKGYAEMAVSRENPLRQSSNSLPTTPLGDNYTDELFQNQSKQNSQFNWKFNSKLHRNPTFSGTGTTTDTPEIEARDFREDLLKNTFFGRTFSQAFSWMKAGGNTDSQQLNDLNNNYSTSSLTARVSLNAYLTYVTLPLQTIMHDVIQTQQQPVLTFQ